MGYFAMFPYDNFWLPPAASYAFMAMIIAARPVLAATTLFPAKFLSGRRHRHVT